MLAAFAGRSDTLAMRHRPCRAIDVVFISMGCGNATVSTLAMSFNQRYVCERARRRCWDLYPAMHRAAALRGLDGVATGLQGA
ncbi:hypothetical protein G8D19_01390 [Xanthomonas vesicatoria]|nr:hypothetical protein [Xanthomonas vesicatoria]